MKDPFLMESHKLNWHLDRVAAWQRGERIAPLHIDVGLSKGCNIRCTYCFGKIQRNLYKRGLGDFLPRDILLNYLRDAAAIGVKSVALIGEAEPLLNPHVYEAIVVGKRAGLDVSLGTNGILLDVEDSGREALEHLSWIRFNLSAASKKSYGRVHGSTEFETVLQKISAVTERKRRSNLNVTVGIQMVLVPTPENFAEILPLARLGKSLGVDYFVVKQCSDNSESACGSYARQENYADERLLAILKEAETLSDGNYRVIVKWAQLQNLGKRIYSTCLGTPFLLFSSGDGKLYPCGQFFDYREEEFRLGDLREMSFRRIFESERYWEVLKRVETCVNVHKDCQTNCRTNKINEFLWGLRSPPDHVNFI